MVNNKKIFLGQCLDFSFSTHKQCIGIKSIKHNSNAMCSLKTLLVPWRDSKPRFSVPEADAMTPGLQYGHLN
jgi:hypothetical protein